MHRITTGFVTLCLLAAVPVHAQGTADLPNAAVNETVDIESLSLEALLYGDVTAGEAGGFGANLQRLGVETFLHGYAAWWGRYNDVNRGNPYATFSQHYFNLVFGAEIADRVRAEIMLEEEHGGVEHALRYGFVDTTIVPEHLVLRLGKFLTPMGVFNEYLYPEYVSLLPDRPLVLWQIVPSVWAEVGAQLRGKIAFGQEREVNYALYVVNGMMQTDSDATDGVVDDGGSIRKMRNNYRDKLGNDKAFGGRLGIVPLAGMEFGASLYTGKYTVDDEQRLTIADIDFSIEMDRFILRGEVVRAWQQRAAGQIIKEGFYVLTAYRIIDELQPVLQYDFAKLADGRRFGRVTGALVFYPYPDEVKRFSFKLAYAMTQNFGKASRDLEDAHEFVLQSALGF